MVPSFLIQKKKQLIKKSVFYKLIIYMVYGIMNILFVRLIKKFIASDTMKNYIPRGSK